MKLTGRGLLIIVAWLAIAVADALLRLIEYKSTGQDNSATLLGQTWFIFSAVIVALLIWEVTVLAQGKRLKIKRHVSQTLPVNNASTVQLEITNLSQQSFSYKILDHYPDFCRVKNLPQFIYLSGQQSITIDYQITAFERGELVINQCEFWLRTRLSLISRRFIIDHKTSSKVYPNYRSIHDYLLLATEQKTRQLGIRQRQRRGDGLDFLQLRDYRKGDSFRQIDWRATSRLRKIISKEYQQERDQNIIFMLDSGRRMRTKDSELSHFDQALNATLLLASIALRQGDAVGLQVFGGKNLFLPPKKGPSVINSILNQVYNLHPTPNASDLIEAAERLTKQFVKRSLVVIVSNVRSEDEIEIKTAVSLLKRHHLVMVTNLKEAIFEDIINQDIYQLEDALTFAESINYLKQREILQKKLNHSGVITVDSFPKHLAVNMVNQYFEIKRGGRL